MRNTVRVYNRDFEFVKEFRPSWNQGSLVKSYTLGENDYMFKVEASNGETWLKIYWVTSKFKLLRKRKFKLGKGNINVKDIQLIKEMEDKYIFLYHIDDKIKVFKCKKDGFGFDKVSDSLKIPFTSHLAISNGIWGWGRNYLSYIQPVYELFE